MAKQLQVLALQSSISVNVNTKQLSIINHLYIDGFYLLVLYNKVEIVHFLYLGMSDYNVLKIVLFCLKIFLP